MTNLFSVFDPAGVFYLTNFVFIGLVMFFAWSLYYFSGSRISSLSGGLSIWVGGDLGSVLSVGKHSVVYCLMGVFVFICFTNFWGLLPYVFTSSSHLCFTMGLGLPLWLSVFFYGFVNFDRGLAHFVPLGSPMFLAPFMVFIEIVSTLARPITLSLRLAANMVAGHLLVGMIHGYSDVCSLSSVMAVWGGGVLLMILELAVSLIQGYVFVLLVSMYLEEV